MLLSLSMNSKTSREDLKNILKKHPFASFFWIGLLLILPFIYSTQILDEDNLPKLIFLSTLMIILSVRSLVYSSFRSFDKVAMIISLIIAIYFSCSFMQSDNFSTGITALFILLLHFCLFLLIRANRLFKSEIIFLLLPVSAIVLCAIAIVQYIMLTGLNFQPAHTIRATLSNKNFLSEALVIYLIFCLAGFKNTTDKTRKLNLTALGLVLMTIILLQTLSAYLCILFFTVVLLPLFIILLVERDLRKKILLRFLVPAFILLASCVFLAMKSKMFNSVKNKIEYAVEVIKDKPLQNINDGRQNSIYERLYLWKNSMKLFSESPVNGIGLSNWQIYWPKYGMQGASHLDAAIMRYEHPHNEYMLLLTETGILGLIIFSSFFIYIFLTGIRLLFSKATTIDKNTIFIMLAGLAAMAILSIFGYPFHRPYTVTLCMLLCLFFLELTDKYSPAQKFTGRLPVVLLLIFSLFSLNIFANRISGEYHFGKALTMQSRGNFSGMLRMIRKAENKYFTTDNSSTPLDWYKGFAMFYQGNDSAMYYYQRAEEQNPYHVQTLSDIGALLENQGRHEEAITYFKRVVSFVPGYYQAHYNLAVAYFNQGKISEALREINARTNIFEEYLKTLDVILARNAEVAAENCGDSTSAQSLVSDKKLLRKINKLAIEMGVAFSEVFCDTIKARTGNN